MGAILIVSAPEPLSMNTSSRSTQSSPATSSSSSLASQGTKEVKITLLTSGVYINTTTLQPSNPSESGEHSPTNSASLPAPLPAPSVASLSNEGGGVTVTESEQQPISQSEVSMLPRGERSQEGGEDKGERSFTGRHILHVLLTCSAQVLPTLVFLN